MCPKKECWEVFFFFFPKFELLQFDLLYFDEKEVLIFLTMQEDILAKQLQPLADGSNFNNTC